MQLNKKHFELFKKECEYWIDKLKLDNWAVYYEMKSVDDDFRGMCYSQTNHRAATIILNENYPELDGSLVDNIKSTAKHEVIHLLTAKLLHLGKSRFANEDSIYEAEEELVVKLEKLL